jgi:SAM-dependent methyltransferase
MTSAPDDGSGASYSYDVIGRAYAARRRPDARVEARICVALGDARSVVNVGAGAGSYEPRDRFVLAVEPSDVMVRQRPDDAAPVVRALAEALPVAGDAFDVALSVLSVHHWSDVAAGLHELRRVAPRQAVLTWDPRVTARFWLVADYLPEIAELERGWDPIEGLLTHLDVESVEPVLVPADCSDGFLAAFWKRPREYLDPGVRAAMSGISLLDQDAVERAMERLARDLDSGAWRDANRDLLELDAFDAGYRLVTARNADDEAPVA